MVYERIISNDVWLEGLHVGMEGEHWKNNPYPRDGPKRAGDIPMNDYEKWMVGWSLGRTCLEFDNPAEIPVKVIPRGKNEFGQEIYDRLIPAWENPPICPDSWEGLSARVEEKE